MPTGVIRILPFAAISAALHAAVLVNAPERLEIAVTPGGDTRAVSVRLAPSGPINPNPTTSSGGRSGPHPEEPVPPTTAEREVTEATARESRAKRAVADESSTTRPDVDPAVTRRLASLEPDHASASRPEVVEKTAAPATDNDAGSKLRSDANPTADPPAADASPEDAARSEQSEQSEQAEQTEQTRGSDQAETVERTVKADPARIGNRDTAHERHDTATGSEGAADRAQLASEARSEVEVRFRDRFRYPRIARQRGWEGRVVLSLRVHDDGRISDVKVIESSGRAILDEDARQTLIHIQRIPELGQRLQSGPLELEVPVTYRLQPG